MNHIKPMNPINHIETVPIMNVNQRTANSDLLRFTIYDGESYFSHSKYWAYLTVILMGLSSVNGTHAASLGQMHLKSHLGEPFKAEIDVFQITPEEIETLKVRLASPEAYRKQGLEYSTTLSMIKPIFMTKGKNAVIKLNGSDLTTEPMFDILLELQHSKGTVVKKFTAFLDPQIRDTPVKPIEITDIEGKQLPKIALKHSFILGEQKTSKASSSLMPTTADAMLMPNKHKVYQPKTLTNKIDKEVTGVVVSKPNFIADSIKFKDPNQIADIIALVPSKHSIKTAIKKQFEPELKDKGDLPLQNDNKIADKQIKKTVKPKHNDRLRVANPEIITYSNKSNSILSIENETPQALAARLVKSGITDQEKIESLIDALKKEKEKQLTSTNTINPLNQSTDNKENKDNKDSKVVLPNKNNAIISNVNTQKTVDDSNNKDKASNVFKETTNTVPPIQQMNGDNKAATITNTPNQVNVNTTQPAVPIITPTTPLITPAPILTESDTTNTNNSETTLTTLPNLKIPSSVIQHQSVNTDEENWYDSLLNNTWLLGGLLLGGLSAASFALWRAYQKRDLAYSIRKNNSKKAKGSFDLGFPGFGKRETFEASEPFLPTHIKTEDPLKQAVTMPFNDAQLRKDFKEQDGKVVDFNVVKPLNTLKQHNDANNTKDKKEVLPINTKDSTELSEAFKTILNSGDNTAIKTDSSESELNLLKTLVEKKPNDFVAHTMLIKFLHQQHLREKTFEQLIAFKNKTEAKGRQWQDVKSIYDSYLTSNERTGEFKHLISLDKYPDVVVSEIKTPISPEPNHLPTLSASEADAVNENSKLLTLDDSDSVLPILNFDLSNLTVLNVSDHNSPIPIKTNGLNLSLEPIEIDFEPKTKHNKIDSLVEGLSFETTPKLSDLHVLKDVQIPTLIASKNSFKK